MFITENQNVGDSVLFLLSSRAALANIIEASNTKNASDLISFIHNEASDYEIMHLLLNGSLPEEKYNDVAEMILFSELKESMLMNHAFVTEMVGEDIFQNVLHEVDSLYEQYSTAAPVLEFEARQDQELGLAWMVHEAGAGAKVAAGKKAKAAQAAIAKAKKLQGANKAADWSPEKVKAAKAAAVKKTAAAKAAAANAGRAKGGMGAPSALSRAKGIAGKKVAAAKGAVKASWDKATASTRQPQWNRGVLQKQKTVGAKVKAAGKYYGKAAKGAATKFAQTPAGKAVGGAAAAALAIYAGAKIYKRFFSQAAKSCAGKSGAEKTACMAKYKKQAIMKQASAIQSAASKCAQSKDPAKCKAAVASKVAGLKAKAAKLG